MQSLSTTKWRLSKVTNFSGMFEQCTSIKELDLSNIDTSKATKVNGMLAEMQSLEKVTFGEKLSTNGSGSITDSTKWVMLPTPDPAHVPGADGNWYDVLGNSYTPSSISSNIRRTYYASLEVMQADSGHLVLVKNGTLMRIAEAIRSKSGKTSGIIPSQFAAEIIGLP